PNPPGDLNGDGLVNGADLSICLGDWGTCPPKGTCLGDINGDGVVNGADLSILLSNWS
ncbi:MAG: dockerin type I domain-containing protein, partial [Phycisphaerales bacterium]